MIKKKDKKDERSEDGAGKKKDVTEVTEIGNVGRGSILGHDNEFGDGPSVVAVGHSGHKHSEHDAGCKDDDLSCSCVNYTVFGDDEEEKYEQEEERPDLKWAAIGFAVLIISLISEEFGWGGLLYIILSVVLPIAAYIAVGKEVLINTVYNLRAGKIFDENFLMSVATISAILIGDINEALAIMVFYNVGEYVNDLAVSRSKRSIRKLLDLKQKIVHTVTSDGIKDIPPEEVPTGTVIVVKPGERVPIDGILLGAADTSEDPERAESEENNTDRGGDDGNYAVFDTSSLTGESIPVTLYAGDPVPAGYITVGRAVKIRTSKEYRDSTVAKIMRLVREAESRKSKTERFITKFAAVYTPIVVFAAVFIALIPPLMGLGPFRTWIYRGLIFLVISCPCALVLSIPLGYFGGIGAASARGILIKGANYIDILTATRTVLFDKTGTITLGKFSVIDTYTVPDFPRDKMIEYTVHAESMSTHPIAESIVRSFNVTADPSKIKDFYEMPAHGIKVMVDDKIILAGNDRMLHRFNILHGKDLCDLDGTVVHVAVDNTYAGYMKVADTVREDAVKAVRDLKKLGVENIAILSGDNRAGVKWAAENVGIDTYYYGLLPDDKLAILENYKKKAPPVVFVGDGINDAPAVAAADVGVVMGGIGSDAAVEIADVVIMNDRISLVPEAIKISRETRRIVMENIITVFAVKVMFLILAAFGLTNMWGALVADVGVSFLSVLNAGRLPLRYGKIKRRKEKEDVSVPIDMGAPENTDRKNKKDTYGENGKKTGEESVITDILNDRNIDISRS